MQQAQDFHDECAALDAALAPLDAADFDRVTQFKDWTINHVLQHLHFFNVMADYSAFEPERFAADYARFSELRAAAGSMVGPTDTLLGGLKGRALLDAWRARYRDMLPRWAAADPKQRVKWAGPDMSVRSSITARQMETWAHGQEVFDCLGLVRSEADRIANICHLGVGTYGWTFVNRNETVPEPAPFVRLTLPSGAVRDWGADNAEERVEGDAVAFAQVVAQTRNIADVDLTVTGPNATRWMALAQCFAGAPNDPPAPGARGIVA